VERTFRTILKTGYPVKTGKLFGSIGPSIHLTNETLIYALAKDLSYKKKLEARTRRKNL